MNPQQKLRQMGRSVVGKANLVIPMRGHDYEAIRSSLSTMQRNVAAGRALTTVAAE